MKEVFIDNFENGDIVNSLKYYYFGKTYNVVNSKMSDTKKVLLLNNIMSELSLDVFLSAKELLPVKSSIEKLIFEKISSIELKIKNKKFKLPFRFGFVRSKFFDRQKEV